MECEPRLRLELDRELSLDGYTASGINKSFFLEMLFPIIHSSEAFFDAKKHVDEAFGLGMGESPGERRGRGRGNSWSSSSTST